MPCITVTCEYDIRTLTALLVGSSYDIAEQLFSLAVPTSYDIAEELFGLAVAASYNIPTPESGALLLSSEYDITEKLFSLSVTASYDLAMELFGLSVPSRLTTSPRRIRVAASWLQLRHRRGALQPCCACLLQHSDTFLRHLRWYRADELVPKSRPGN